MTRDIARRILVVDDTKAIHDDFEKLFFSNRQINISDSEHLDSLEQELFGASVQINDPLEGLEMDSAFQGEEAVKMVSDSLVGGSPYLLVFVDMRMPPGIDGLETIERIWDIDPRAHIVICSAYSDYTWRDILSKSRYTEQLLVLKKPFDYIEVLQIVKSMTEKWYLAREAHLKEDELRALVYERTLELESISQHKTEFLSTMSHELRTPLNGVLGFSKLLTDQFYGSLNDKQLNFAEQTHACATHLLRMVDEVLDFVKVDSGALEAEPEITPLEPFVRSVISMLESQFIMKGIKVRVDVASSVSNVYTDRRKALQILLNLLSNAIKYTQAGDVISIRGELQDNDTARISIVDTGVGIKPELKSSLFEEFFQVDRSRDESLGGTGLGLALSRKFVELQGGDIGVDSVYGEGSTFWFTVPIAPEPFHFSKDAQSLPRVSTERRIESARILIAEDNEVNILVVDSFLKAFGVETMIARNGQEAIDLVAEFEPDLILMDIRMPVLNGIEAIKLLKSNNDYCDIPIIALTANADNESIDECLNAGASAHLSKPVKSDVLKSLIAENLREGWDTQIHHK